MGCMSSKDGNMVQPTDEKEVEVGFKRRGSKVFKQVMTIQHVMKDGRPVKKSESTKEVLITDEAEKRHALKALAGKIKGAMMHNKAGKEAAGMKRTGSFAGDMAVNAIAAGGKKGRDSFAAANAPVLARKPSRTDDMAVEDPAAMAPLTDEEIEPLEGLVLKMVNKVRANPQLLVKEIQERLGYLNEDTNVFWLPGRSVGLRSTEGKKVYKEAISFLKAQGPVQPLEERNGMKAGARVHAEDMGETGQRGHFGSDGSTVGKRVNRFGRWRKKIGENIDYGRKSAMETVMAWAVDDGVPNRGHRANLFSERFAVCGVGAAPHKEHSQIVVLTLATDYEEGARD